MSAVPALRLTQAEAIARRVLSLGSWIGLPALAPGVLVLLAVITVAYVGSVERLKTRLFRASR